MQLSGLILHRLFELSAHTSVTLALFDHFSASSLCHPSSKARYSVLPPPVWDYDVMVPREHQLGLLLLCSLIPLLLLVLQTGLQDAKRLVRSHGKWESWIMTISHPSAPATASLFPSFADGQTHLGRRDKHLLGCAMSL